MAERHPFNLPGDTAHYAPDRAYSAQHVRVDLTLDVPRRRLAGSVTYTLLQAGLAAGPDRPELVLDAAEMTIERVEPAASWTHDEGRLRIVPSPGPATFSLTISYSAEPRKGLYFLAPDEGHPERPTQAWTQGQAEDTRYWLPSFDTPNHKLTTELSAVVPAGWTVVSNGHLVSHETEAEGGRWHYRQDVPHPAYLITLAAGEFSQVRDSWRDLPVDYFVPPGREADGQRAFGNTVRMLEFFSHATGVDYPYAKYAQVAVADFIYGGMENTSATTQTDRTLHDARAHLDFSSDPLVSHELAHQWFGDLVTCKDWAHAWLNESFATYCEALWREHDLGQDEFLFDLFGLLQSYLGEDRERYRRPIVTNIYAEPSDLFDRHLYEKGGLVLHTLRRDLGDAAWWASVKHYLEAHRAGNVITVDLQRAIEDVTGRNLEAFFQQWVFSPGHPELKVSCSWDAATKLASIGLRQQQHDPKTAPGGGPPLYTLKFDLVLLGDWGEQVVPVKLDAAERTITLPLAGEPRRLRFDPHAAAPLRTTEFELPTAMLRRQLADDPSVLSRIEAAQSLAKKADRESTAALATALTDDRFWGVQQQVARALADVKSGPAKQALLGGLTTEHPKARRGVVEALGAFREPDVAEALQAAIAAGDASYFVEAEAYRSLGKTRHTPAYDTLVAGLERESFDDVIRQGVFDGLKELRDDRAVDVALEWTAYGRSAGVRAAAVRALEHLGEKLSRVDDRLEELLDDQRIASMRVRATVVGVLRRRKKAEAVGALQRVAERDVDERLRRLAREAVRAVRDGVDRHAEVKDLHDRLDTLTDDNRKLRDRLDKLEAASLVEAGSGEGASVASG